MSESRNRQRDMRRAIQGRQQRFAIVNAATRSFFPTTPTEGIVTRRGLFSRQMGHEKLQGEHPLIILHPT